MKKILIWYMKKRYTYYTITENGVITDIVFNIPKKNKKSQKKLLTFLKTYSIMKMSKENSKK